MGSMSLDKQKAVELAMGQIERWFGKGSIMRLGVQAIADIPVISTGSLALDHALGVGGIPRGRVIEIFGSESSGKTTLALHVVAEAQKRDGVAAFIDAEHALDVMYAKKLGVNSEYMFGQRMEIATFHAIGLPLRERG
jgi:recombination protein RecA